MSNGSVVRVSSPAANAPPRRPWRRVSVTVSARGEGSSSFWHLPVPQPPIRTNTRTCRNSRGGCRLSRSRGGTCRRWGCPGTARCRPVAHSSLRPYRLGAGERCPVSQHERGPLTAALPSTIPPCSSLLVDQAGSQLWAFALAVPATCCTLWLPSSETFPDS